MRTHCDIDARSLAMARAIVEKIDADAKRTGLERARSVCRHWYSRNTQSCVREWLDILEKPWRDVRSILLDQTESGQRLRQSSPFCGILTPTERWRIYKDFGADETQRP